MAGTWPMVRNPLHYPVRLIQTGILCAVGVWEWCMNPPATGPDMICFTVFLCALMAAGVFPVPGNLLVVASFCVDCFFFDVQGPSQLLGVTYAIGTLTYDTAIWIGCTLCVPTLFAMAAQTYHRPNFQWFNGYAQVPILTMLLTLMLFFSIISRLRSQLLADKQASDQATELKRRVEVARLVHDSVTGDLSNIARIAQRQIRMGRFQTDEDREAWEQVNDRSIRVLDSVHAVIRTLNTGDQDAHRDDLGPSNERYLDMLRAKVKDLETKLDEAGLHGDVRVIDHVHNPQTVEHGNVGARRRCVVDTINEAFANIMRHGVAGDHSYEMTITIEDEQSEIVAVNRMSPDERCLDETGGPVDAQPVLPGGSGLKLHREQVERFGGVLSADGEDGDWILYARIPRKVMHPNRMGRDS